EGTSRGRRSSSLARLVPETPCAVFEGGRLAEAVSIVVPEATRRVPTADRVFRGAVLFTSALTAFWLFSVVTRRESVFFPHYAIAKESLGRVAFGFLFFWVLWGLVWYGVKNLLLKALVGMTKAERRDALSSRMDRPFDLPSLLARYSERRIR